jgi:hypothetical protein
MRDLRHMTAAFLFCTLLSLAARAQERRVYEGVVSWKKLPIGTIIMLEIHGNNLTGWMRVEKAVAIDGGHPTEDGVEFTSGANHYAIDERRSRINYTGPEGEGDRYITKLTRLTGRLQELVEETEEQPRSATIEVNGRNRELRYGAPTLWKRNGPPFEKFERLDELLGKQVSIWVADADLRSGRIVAIEEPEGVDIPLKAPKKPKEKTPPPAKNSRQQQPNGTPTQPPIKN